VNTNKKGHTYEMAIIFPHYISAMLLGATAAAGYFGDRSLYVIGALSALDGAVSGSLMLAK
jgi:hypothetical protein